MSTEDKARPIINLATVNFLTQSRVVIPALGAHVIDALKEAGLVIEEGWQPISTAPQDGTLIDVWCKVPVGNDFIPQDGGIRLTRVFWHEANDMLGKTGWVRGLDDGDWDPLESSSTANPGSLPPWQPTHWQLPPAPPEATP